MISAPVGADLWFDHIRSSSLVVHWKPIDDALKYYLVVTPDIGDFTMQKMSQYIEIKGKCSFFITGYPS